MQATKTAELRNEAHSGHVSGASEDKRQWTERLWHHAESDFVSGFSDGCLSDVTVAVVMRRTDILQVHRAMSTL